MLGSGEGGTIKAVAKTIELTTPGAATPMVITGQVERLVRTSGVATGTVTCCAIGVGVSLCCLDGEEGRLGLWEDRLRKLVADPDPAVAAQLLSQAYGQSLTLPIERGTIVRDPWQQVVLVDFGAEIRRRLVSVISLGE